MSIISGIFLVLHGLVHLLYFGQSARLFELKKGMTWPDGSLIFSRPFGKEITRDIASSACVLAAIGFIVGGIAVFFSQEWYPPAVISSAVFSLFIFTLFWDGQLRTLHERGLVAIFINLAIIITLFVF